MEELQRAVTGLTGAVNAALEQLKIFERRLLVVEARSGQVEPSGSEGSGTVVPLCAPANEQDLKDISRLPDCVKELQAFEGDPTQYVSWVHCVEMILQDFEIVRHRPIYRSILQHIRGKVRGDANQALIAYNIFGGDWPEIKSVLSHYYADKRDINTLEHQLNKLSQKNSSIDDFYSAVNYQLSLMVNKVKTESHSPDTVRALIEAYRNRALDIFVRGLNRDLSNMVRVQRPKTLPEAYTACLELQNSTLRDTLIHPHSHSNIMAPLSGFGGREDRAPPVPQRSLNARENRSYNRPNWQQQRGNAPPRPTAPKPAEKMDVDRSIQSRQVNYMNRPQTGNPFKRQAGSSPHNPSKQQRVYNVMTEGENGDNELEGEEFTDQVNFMTDASPAYLT